MELPELGNQCSEITCKQLDFLPLKCDKCDKKFCLEHFHLHAIVCKFESQKSEVNLTKFDSLKCDKCGIPVSVPIVCNYCHRHFCVQHRHFNECATNDSTAPITNKSTDPICQFNEAKSAIDRQFDKNLIQFKKKGKNMEMINKLQLMKLKNKAIGLKTIPVNDRVYFSVSVTKVTGKSESVPVFVSKNWSVGRAIDAIALECKLINNNNVEYGKKLRLFRENGDVLTDVSDILENLLKSGFIVNGGNLIINYVNDC